jgi:hypothetical protein
VEDRTSKAPIFFARAAHRKSESAEGPSKRKNEGSILVPSETAGSRLEGSFIQQIRTERSEKSSRGGGRKKVGESENLAKFLISTEIALTKLIMGDLNEEIGNDTIKEQKSQLKSGDFTEDQEKIKLFAKRFRCDRNQFERAPEKGYQIERTRILFVLLSYSVIIFRLNTPHD